MCLYSTFEHLPDISTRSITPFGKHLKPVFHLFGMFQSFGLVDGEDLHHLCARLGIRNRIGTNQIPELLHTCQMLMVGTDL
ncbi:unnamed protein product [Periconia digitata]|uniref:Uncharacterized protein n=1 Tax=Periconia digitata TaxID=1303443 RepID=A0A9W4USR3_9PLEO|nr:unnamed protein product [Periconia digitata]